MEISDRLETLEEEIANNRDMLVDLSISATRRFRDLEEKVRSIDEQGREAERQIIKEIKAKTEFIQDYYGVEYRFKILKNDNFVIAYTTNTYSTEGVARLTNNPYYDMLKALYRSLKDSMPYKNSKPPTLINYTSEQISKEIGCIVEIYE